MSKIFSGLLARFARDTGGNVAIIFGLAVLPLIGFAGIAVDYARANNARTAMQNALDSAALMLSKDAATLTQAQITEKANLYFNAMFKNADAKNVSVGASYTPTAMTQTVALTASATVPSEFMHILGINQIPISTETSAAWGTTRLRVALALDTTGSMADAGKMTALKPAAKNLIDQLAALEKSPGDVYISIVPFSKDVNVGAANSGASWLNWSAWDAANGNCSLSGGQNNTKNKCLNNGGTWTPKSHDQWNGCVTDRDQNYDVTNIVPTADVATQFVPEQYGSCPSALMPLSTDWSALKNKIDALYPAGNTNQTIGLAWGWQTLNTGPFTYPPESEGYTYKRAIVLMSDGLNTQNRWTSSESSIDAREAALCANVKISGVTLYTIHVNTNGDPTSTVLQNCASSPDKFYTMTDASQLSGVFTQIASQLTMLRLAK
jgi:Flp pilus assembly protein TadG